MAPSVNADPIPSGSIRVTVFVHGSIFSSLAILDLSHTIDDTLTDDSLYVSMVRHIRKNQILYGEQAILDEGLQYIEPSIIQAVQQGTLHADASERQYAAYFVAAAYDTALQQAQMPGDVRAYYTFGHLGLLSQKYRRSVVGAFYDALCNLRTSYLQQYAQVYIDIVAHSHGGNCALSLVDEELRQQRGLKIDHLVLYGTPMQFETAHFAYRTEVQWRVINCHSPSDRIQGCDWISTSFRKSYQRFYDPSLPIIRPELSAPHVHDVRIHVDGDTNRVGHVNMWLMRNHQMVCSALGPLPYVVVTPHIIRAVMDATQKEQQRCEFDFDLIARGAQFSFRLMPFGNAQLLYHHVADYDQMKQLHITMTKQWLPASNSRNVLFNKKTRVALMDAFRRVRAERKAKSKKSP